ncbi:MAG: hypothetical protein ACT4PU_08100 [Planctomycetota bacterium]
MLALAAALLATAQLSAQDTTPAPSDPAASPRAAAPAQTAPPSAATTPSAPLPPSTATLFANKLQQALALELEVQAVEQSTLGLEERSALSGHRLQRFDRIQKDKDFRALAGQFSRVALELPRPADVAKAGLPRRSLDLLTDLAAAYRVSREVRPLDLYMEANRNFVKQADWAMRDRAVLLRDEIIEREIGYTRLVSQAYDLVNGQVGPQGLAEMEALLAKIAPEVVAKGNDLAVQVLRDPTLRQQVLDELTAQFREAPPARAAPRPAGTLRVLIEMLQLKLLQRAELAPVITEHAQLEASLALLAVQMKEAAGAMDQEQRAALVERIVTETTRRNDLEVQWYSTAPDPELYAQLVEAQEELIVRLCLDLGPKGAYFGPRRDEIAHLIEQDDGYSPRRWQVLEAQQDLIIALNDARPTPGPLAGLAPPLISLSLGSGLGGAPLPGPGAKGAGAKGPGGKGAGGKAGPGGKPGALGKAVAKPKSAPQPGAGLTPAGAANAAASLLNQLSGVKVDPKLIQQGTQAAQELLNKPR